MTSSVTRIIEATFPLGERNSKGKWLPYSGTWYRNAHYFISNKVKVHYTEVLAKPQIEKLTPMKGVVYSLFVFYRPNKRRCDLDNYTSIHKKFFHDALTTYGIIEDDDTIHVPLQISVYGGIDKDNPRVDVYVTQDLLHINSLARKYLCPECP